MEHYEGRIERQGLHILLGEKGAIIGLYCITINFRRFIEKYSLFTKQSEALIMRPHLLPLAKLGVIAAAAGPGRDSARRRRLVFIAMPARVWRSWVPGGGGVNEENFDEEYWRKGGGGIGPKSTLWLITHEG